MLSIKLVLGVLCYMVLKHAWSKSKTPADSNGQKCKWLDGCAASVCLSKDHLNKLGREYRISVVM